MSSEKRQYDFEEVESFVEPLHTDVKEIPEPAHTETPDAGSDNKKPIRAKEFLDGSILVRETIARQLPFILFLTVLAVLYIGNRYHAERMVRNISELEQEVKNLRAEQITTAAELMNISKPSVVSAIVESKNLGLKQSVEPPKKLIRKRGL
jgi:hypothetical protein